MRCDTLIKFTLEPTYHNDYPDIEIGLDDTILFDDKLDRIRTFQIDYPMTQDEHQLWIVLKNKTNANHEQGVKIQRLSIENITANRFIWAGKYYPIYPEPWASQQKNSGVILPEFHKNIDYLGWNGRWVLNFTVPVFTWIHQVENLGWIYSS